jgi:hypothetical protein
MGMTLRVIKNDHPNYWRRIYLAIAKILLASLAFGADPVISANSDYLYQILSTGQSLAVGYSGKTNTKPLTTTQPFINGMLDSCNENLMPLVEPSTTIQHIHGETIGSTMANSLSASEGGDYQTVVTNHAYGGYCYDYLKKGTVPYKTGIKQLKSVHELAKALGKTHKVTGITVVHGESDQLQIYSNWGIYQLRGYKSMSNVYRDHLIAWQRDYERDVKAITGQQGTVPLFTDQMSSHTGAGHAFPISAIGQLDAARENPGKIILVGPKYFFNYVDQYHLTNHSYRLLGEYFGKVIDQVINGQEWMPLYPVSITRFKNIIYVRFHLPWPATKLVFDTQSVDKNPHMGFEYSDSGKDTFIRRVQIADSDTVKITLSKIPAGSKQTIRYAFTGTANAIPGAHSSGSAKGNLRDDDPTTANYDNSVHLYNWAVHFSGPVVGANGDQEGI